MACTPQQIKHTRQIWQAPNFTSMDRARIYISYYVNFGACQSWPMLNPHFKNTLFFGSVSPLWHFSVQRSSTTIYTNKTKLLMKIHASIEKGSKGRAQ
jgi:hypothetical protein